MVLQTMLGWKDGTPMLEDTTDADLDFPQTSAYVLTRIRRVIVDMMRKQHGVNYMPSTTKWKQDPAGNQHLFFAKPLNGRDDAASIFIPTGGNPEYTVAIYNRGDGATYQSSITFTPSV